jgi:transcriptional regulator of arginine metabolism
MLSKSRRRRQIAQLLRDRDVSSQAELARALRASGARTTQATLSRDLEDLGAYKARLPDGRTAYRLPDEPPAPNGDALRRLLEEFVLGVENAGNLVVVKTPPGGASPVARALDRAELQSVVGTVAGDDTILVVVRDESAGVAVVRRLRTLAGLSGVKREA